VTRTGAALLLCAVLNAAGCAALSPSRRIYEQYARLDADRIPAEIPRWTDLAREDAANSDPVRAGAHLRLALLYSHPDNPDPRFDLALEHLESYAALDPEGARDVEIRRLHEILEDLSRCVLRGERRKEVADLLWKSDQEVRKRLEALRKDSRGMTQAVGLLVEEELELRRQNDKLQRRNEELEKSAQDLSQQNADLKDKIEQLKKLDLQMEKIRSGKGSP
jgi:hypothetical protein